jgi:hypothetical protein
MNARQLWWHRLCIDIYVIGVPFKLLLIFYPYKAELSKLQTAAQFHPARERE